MNALTSHNMAAAKPSRSRQAGMSLVELAFALALLAAVLGTLVLINRSQRIAYARTQTHQSLQMLHNALTQYQQAHGSMPAGDTHATLQRLLADPEAGRQLEPLQIEHQPDGQPIVRDGFARPIHYQPPHRGMPADFVSAGPSGQLGDPHAEDEHQRRAAADNIYSSELEITAP